MNFNNLQTFIFLAVIISRNEAAETDEKPIDYCNKELCPYQGPHVRCGNDGEFSTNCTGDCHMEDMMRHIPTILFDHNMYRNQLACGHLNCFYPATRMPALVWDWELARNAEYNARSCIFGHDKCRSTPTFPYAGQNIYYAKTSRLEVTPEQFMGEAMFMWYEEFLFADLDLMESYRRTVPQTGHFTTLMCDRSHRVGCALLINKQWDGRRFKLMIIFTCDYPSTNIKNMPTYKPGEVGADCKRRNVNFSCLCDDEIDPNDIYWYGV